MVEQEHAHERIVTDSGVFDVEDDLIRKVDHGVYFVDIADGNGQGVGH